MPSRIRQRTCDLPTFDPQSVSCPHCDSDLTRKGECAACRRYLCRHCGCLQHDDTSVSWESAILLLLLFPFMLALWYVTTMVVTALFGSTLFWLMIHLCQTKCRRCHKRAPVL